VTDSGSIGAHLRSARRRRRVSIERAAEETRIRADYLMRMESDEFDFLAPAYVRGFLRSYARFLSVDPEPLIADFDHRFGNPKADTSSILAIERRVKHAPRQPRKRSNWGVAAALAAGAMLVLGLVGLLQPTPGEQGARVSDNNGSTPTATASPPQGTPSPSPTPTPSATETLAAVEGIDLRIDASTARCWIDVTADGEFVFQGTLEVGDSRRFRADKEMSIVLGYPAGVELNVNGRNLGSPGNEDPITIQLPDDIDQL
jgi:cytoskeleton protein RodZ